MGKEGLSKAVASEIKPIRTIDAPLTISGNQFWSADYDYKISSEITIQASSSLSIENGSKISIIDNGSFLIEGGVLNIGSVYSTSSVNNGVDFLSLVNSSGNLISLATADEVFASSVYKSSNILNTKIEISGAGYNEIFGVYNGGIINVRKLDIENTLSEGVYSDLGRSLFGLYNASKVNLFETNINNIKVPGSKAFFADNNSRIILYRSNINGFVGWNFANISRSTVLNILRTKMNDIKTDGVINIFTKSVLNFKESFISATPLDESGYNSGTCISAFKDTTVDVADSDIGPCFVAFYFSGIGNFKVNQNNLVGNSLVVSNFSPSVDLKNNWWGRVEGPRSVNLSTLDPDGNYSTIEYRAAIKNQNAVRDFSNGVVSSPFATVPFKDASPCCSSVLFIPGIQS